MTKGNNKMSDELIESIAVSSGESVDQIKKKMEEIDERALEKELREQQNVINEAFEKFLAEPIPAYLDDLYEFTDNSAVVRIFDFEPQEKKADLFVTLSRKASSMPYMTFSIGKVLLAGESCKYKKGDIVKLRDLEIKTLKNPRYEAWVSNPWSKSNAKKVGEAPPAHVSQAITVFGQKMFMINPLLVDVSDKDWITFKINEMNIEAKIKNPRKLLEVSR